MTSFTGVLVPFSTWHTRPGWRRSGTPCHRSVTHSRNQKDTEGHDGERN